jgi:phage repressor protein C with HTH and peptisase S24 domain
MPTEDSPVVAARRARLREWIDTYFSGKQADFVAVTGINQGELSGLLKTKSFGEKKAAALEIAAGMPAGYLVAAAEPAAVDGDNYDPWANVTGYAQSVGLGTRGPEAAEWAETHMLKFRKDSLARKRLHAKNLAVMYGTGDSMEPTIKHGDAILFDTTDTHVVDKGIYVLLVPGAGSKEYAVKRAVHMLGARKTALAPARESGYVFVSDNPDGDHDWKEPRPLTKGLKIIGRVRWVGGWVR